MVRRIVLTLVATMLMCFALGVRADSVLGVPVNGLTGVNATTQSVPNCPTLEGSVCYNTSTGKMTFFIPLSSANSGVYGYTNVGGGHTAGTFSDIGSGTTNALTMNLMFSPVATPVSSANLTFMFTDLDLSGMNDPTNFFESVQFFSSSGTTLTGVISSKNSSGGGTLNYTITGNYNTQTIYFPDVTSIVQNPFYVQLKFSSQYNTTGQNTPEDLIATLQTTRAVPPSTPAVPEPSTLLLLGSGLAGMAARKFRQRG